MVDTPSRSDDADGDVRLAQLLLPADGSGVLMRSEDFRGRPSSDAPVVWGREPLASGAGAKRIVAHAAARTRARFALAMGGRTSGAVRWHDLPPARLRGRFRERLRRLALGGALVEIGSPPSSPRLIDVIAADAGVDLDDTVRFGTDGAAIAWARRDGEPLVMRIAPVEPNDVAGREAEALQWLTGTPLVPQLHGHGVMRGWSWCVEERLPGSPARTVDGGLLERLSSFCASLPRRGEPADVGDLCATLAPVLSVRQEAELHRALEPLSGIAAVFAHGDLWSGNVLVHRGRVSGVVDWDAGQPGGVPGVDLLHLWATHVRRRRGLSIGRAWLNAPWRDDAFVRAASAYYDELGIPADDDLERAVALAWWAGQIGRDIRRDARLAADTAWRAANVTPVASLLT